MTKEEMERWKNIIKKVQNEDNHLSEGAKNDTFKKITSTHSKQMSIKLPMSNSGSLN
jgi:uncharacterized membrane protein (DUF106 family)